MQVLFSYFVSLPAFQLFFSLINAPQTSFVLSTAPSFFRTQVQLHPTPIKSSTLPPRKMSVFQGVAPRHVNWAHPFLFGTCLFVRAYCCVIFSSYLASVIFGLVLPILLFKCIYACKLSVVYVYSKGMQYYSLLQKSSWLRVFYCNDNMNFYGEFYHI